MPLFVACGPSTSPGPGQETGSCIDQQCDPGLQCLSDVCVDPDATMTGGTDGTGGPTTAGPTGGPVTTGVDESSGTDGPPPVLDSVSVLIVHDNSGSMGEEQATLATTVVELAEALTAQGVDWRIGITTTDNGNPWCDGTSPEGGRLTLSSCRSRTQDFVFAGAVMVDATDEACLNICPEQWANLETIPTSAEGSDVPMPRPWIEQVGGVTNLPAGLSMDDALRCVVPQGISGCGFEQPLESMNQAIARASAPGDANAGFIPSDALLAVLVVSDEADCSHNPTWETIFLPDGNRVFWSNPEDGAPTSAVCWNAGVQCNGGSCSSADLDVDGGPAIVPETDAVLHPVSRYLDGLGDPQRTVFALLGGVGPAGSVVYADSQIDPGFQIDFGIGPGCESASGRAVPPVRMREVSEAFSVGPMQSLFSICNDDYSPAMEAFAALISARMAGG